MPEIRDPNRDRRVEIGSELEKSILAGPAGNIWVEAHLGDFLEQGFAVAMVRDATAGARTDGAQSLAHE